MGLLAIGCLGLIGYVIIAALVRGFVLSYLWTWFLVPLGVAPIGVVHAIGFAMLVGLLTASPESTQSGESKDVSEAIGKMIALAISPLLVLLFGYIVHLFM